uniref:Uncharacterized protein n=1 Tax=Bionectria ochroleuca TaxID=29856 RepID=A0A8H7K5G9_BIOOC
MPRSAPTFEPTLILHGRAGFFQRTTLSPERQGQYQDSLGSYLRSTYTLLKNGSTALDAVVHAVSLMEDDLLFDAGLGSVFTAEGTIEMEESVMVTSVRDSWEADVKNGSIKRGAGVLLVKNVRHPIKLAREALLRAGVDSDGRRISDGGNLHTQISGPSSSDEM